MKLMRLLSSLMLVSLLLTACGGSAPPSKPGAPSTASGQGAASGPARGGTLRVALTADAHTLDPHKSTLAVERQVYQALFDTLLTFDEKMQIQPGLAESWQQPDPKTIVFKLRQGVKFHDGTDFDAEAVKWNIERMKDKNSGSARYSELSNVASVDVVDKSTVKFNLTAPFTPLLALLTDRAGMMVSPKAVKELGDDFARKPVGTGPFQLVEWVKDDHITVKRFEQYWDKDKVYLDKITFKPIIDESVRLTNLRTGNIDITNAIAPKDVAAVKGDANLVMMDGPSLGYDYIIINAAKPPFDKKEARQALAWAIDREGILKSIYFNIGKMAQGPISYALGWAYDPSFAPYGHDAAKAKELLAKAGMPNGFEFEMQCGNSTVTTQICQALSAGWAEIGVKANIKLLEPGTVVDNMTKGQHQMGVGSWSGRTDPDDDIYRFFHSKGAQNSRFQWSDPKVDADLDQARVASDPKERARLYQEAQQIIVEGASLLFFHFPAETAVRSKKVQGYQHLPDGMMRFKGVWLEQK
jgi:peptide/nickel transport system substrate-binding protein